MSNLVSQMELFHHFKDLNQSYKIKEEIYRGRMFSFYKEIIQAIIEDSAWISISGEIGSGKTYLLREVYSDLLKEDKTLRVIPIINPDRSGLKITSILRTIVYNLGDELLGDKSPRQNPEALSIQVQNIFRAAGRKNIRLIIHIDEAQEMSLMTLKALKRLREFSFLDKTQQVAVVMVGQPALAGKLERDIEVGRRCRLFLFNYSLSELAAIARIKSNQMLSEAECIEVARKLKSPLQIDRSIADAYQKAYLNDAATITINDIEFPDEPKPIKKRGRKSQADLDTDLGRKLLNKHVQPLKAIANE